MISEWLVYPQVIQVYQGCRQGGFRRFTVLLYSDILYEIPNICIYRDTNRFAWQKSICVTKIDLRDTNQFATLQNMCMYTFNAFNGYVILIV